MVVTGALREQISRGEISDVIVMLAEISHPSFPTFFLANNFEDVTANGNVYKAVNMSGVLPPQVKDELPSINLSIVDIDSSLLTSLRKAVSLSTGRPRIKVWLVLTTSPSIIEEGPHELPIAAVQGDALNLSLSLGVQDSLDRSFPRKKNTPSVMPLVWRRG